MGCSLGYLTLSLVFFFQLTGGTARAADSAAGDNDIDSLLKQVDRALAPSSPTPAPETSPAAEGEKKPAPRRRAAKPKTQSPSDPVPMLMGTEPVSPATQERFTAPLDHSSLAEILSADTQARHADLRSINQGYLLRLGALMWRMESGYRLSKDDDNFDVRHASLPGIAMTFQPSWHLSALSPGTLRTRLTLGLGAAVALGRAKAQRTGVISGSGQYHYFVVPVQADVGLLAQWKDYVGVQIAYGYGADIVSQRGTGVTDTTNALFGADNLSVTFRLLWSAETELFFTWAKRGLGLLPPLGRAGGLRTARGTRVSFGWVVKRCGSFY